jgi:hypothetical protein
MVFLCPFIHAWANFLSGNPHSVNHKHSMKHPHNILLIRHNRLWVQSFVSEPESLKLNFTPLSQKDVQRRKKDDKLFEGSGSFFHRGRGMNHQSRLGGM